MGKFVSADDVRNATGGSTQVTLVCKGQYLSGANICLFAPLLSPQGAAHCTYFSSFFHFDSELYTCWNHVKGIVTGRTTCPVDVQKEDTCTASQIYIQEWVIPSPVAAPSITPFTAPTRSPFISDDKVPLDPQPGDLIVLGFDSVNPDLVYVASLVKIPNNFTFYITDNGWMGTSFRTGEGVMTCVLSNGMAAGQVFVASTSSCTLAGAFDLSTSGDNFFLYTGDESAPTWLYGVTYTGTWVGTPAQVSEGVSNKMSLSPTFLHLCCDICALLTSPQIDLIVASQSTVNAN